MNDVVAVLGNPAVVSYENQCLFVDSVYSAEEVHDVGACFGVQVASGFVSENYCRVVD